MQVQRPANLIFFNSRSTLRRKSRTVRLSWALSGSAKLTVHLTPGEPLRSAEGEGAVGEPEVQVESQGAAFERREGIHVNRYRVVMIS